MKRNKIFSLILIATMSIMALSACNSSGETSQSEVKPTNAIKLGLIGPLTGDASIYGIAVKNGIDLAIEEINAGGGVLDKKIQLEALDDKNDISEAVNAYNNLVSKQMVALLGTVTSKPSIAVAEIASEERMPMLTPTGTAQAITTYGDNSFRVCFTDPFQGKTMGVFAAENLKVKNVAVIYDNSNDYSEGLAKSFIETVEAKGLTVVANESYGEADKDFRTQLTKIQAAQPEVLFIPDYYQKIALIATQAREIGFDKPMLGGDGWDGVLEVLDSSNKKVVDNCYFSNHYSVNDTDKLVSDFVTNFKAKYNETPNAFAALAYDSAYIMTNAIKSANSTDKEEIIKALKEMTFDGVTGHITFDENGDPIKSVSIIKLENGEASLDSKIIAE